MTLEKRLVKLEARRAVHEGNAGARDKLAALLKRTETAVVASGDTSDTPSASPIERTVRRYLRGESDMADALRDLMQGRFP